jgi:type VI secretion system lysozyme-like protein
MKPQVRLLSRVAKELGQEGAETFSEEGPVLESIREYVYWLLNSHRGEAFACKDFGLPDIGSLVIDLRHSGVEFCRVIKDTIEKLEPRVAEVRVELQEMKVGSSEQGRFGTSDLQTPTTYLGHTSSARVGPHFLVELRLKDSPLFSKRPFRGEIDSEGRLLICI